LNNNTKKEFLESLLDFWNEKEPEAISWTDLQSKTFLCKRNKYPQSIHIYIDYDHETKTMTFNLVEEESDENK